MILNAELDRASWWVLARLATVALAATAMFALAFQLPAGWMMPVQSLLAGFVLGEAVGRIALTLKGGTDG